MTDQLTALPDVIDAGTTVTYTRTLGDFPASAGWTLTLYLAGASIANAAGTPSGDNFIVTIPAGTTANLVAGTYHWVERVTKAGQVFDAASGTVVVRPNLATATAGDFQSWAEKTLPIVEAAIAGQLDEGMAEYQIHSRAVKLIPLEELMKLRAQLTAALAQKRTGRFTTPVAMRFTTPC